MLSSRERLQERQGQYAPPRHEYLQQLVDEYQRSVHALRKEEVVANLANFAYDPINYASLAQLQVMDLFLDILDADHEATRQAQQQVSELTENGSGAVKRKRGGEQAITRRRQLAEFAIGGICNCIADPVLQHAFLSGDGFPLVEPYIWSLADISEPLRGKRHASRLNTVLSALSIAYFLLDSSAFAVVASEPLRTHIQSLELHANTQVANTAAAFRTRYEELLLHIPPVVVVAPPLPPGPPPPLAPQAHSDRRI